MEKEYFRNQTEFIEFDPNTNIVTTVSNNPEAGCFYYSSFKHRGPLEFEGALYQAKIATKFTAHLQTLAQSDNTQLSATDEYGRTVVSNPYQMAMRHDYTSNADEFVDAFNIVKEKILNQ